MKKYCKFALALSLAIVLVLGAVSFAFADTGLQVVKAYPEDGANNLQPANIAMKLTFNEGVAQNAAANKSFFSVVNAETKKAEPIRVIYTDTEGEILVLLEKDLAIATSYIFTIGAGFTADNGDELAEDYVINFTVRDTAKDGRVNAIMMFAMMGAIMLFSTKAAKNQQQKEDDKSGKSPEKVNPYKEAKKSGKSVEEIVKEDQKQKAKDAERKAKKAAKLEKELEGLDLDYEEELPLNTYRVHAKKPIVKGENTEKYFAAKKAAEEAAAKARASKGTTNPKKKGKKK